MGVYYYMVCVECKIETTVIGKSKLYLGDEDVCKDLANIYEHHKDHDLRVVSEYAFDDLDGYTEIREGE